MRRVGSVQQKIPCVFLTEVKEQQSRKRDCQQFQVVATENVNPVALEADVDCALATEKLDGTCCYVTLYKGRAHLWARLDRKANKQAEKRFRKHQRSPHSGKGIPASAPQLHVHSSLLDPHSLKRCSSFSPLGPQTKSFPRDNATITNYQNHNHTESTGQSFTWNVEEDFKTVPETWIPAHRVKHHNSLPVPDEHGHIPGWVPVEKDNKQYCWHASVVDCDGRAALVLGPCAEDEDVLEVAAVQLADLLEQTLELIGTNVNGNPYGLGSKQQPVHCLVSHGSVPIRNPPPVDFRQLCSWFQESPESRVEGIVWHCTDGTLVKVHRHHLGLRWPDGETSLAERAVVVRVGEYNNSKDLFSFFSVLNGRRFSRLQDVKFAL